MNSTQKRFLIDPQPDDTSCGPTCLHSVYRFYQDHISLKQVIDEVKCLQDGGTLAVHLANHALKRGYEAKIYTYNLHLFDPVWFKYENINIKRKLILQQKFKKSLKLTDATSAYIEFLENGGILRFKPLTSRLLTKHLKESVPILTGLSATYLYQSKREVQKTMKTDDVRGTPTGHFVVLYGVTNNRKILVADPYEKNPFSKDQKYKVYIDRLIGSILLGIVTYDANLLIIRKKEK